MLLENSFLQQLERFRATLQAVRIPLVIAGATLFLVGAWWSLEQLRLSVADIRPGFLALLLLAMPVSLFYSGVGLLIIARSGGVHMPLGRATLLACHAGLAEALPIPGGAIVRSGALMAHGVSMVRSITLVTANAVLWIAISAAGAGLVILPYSTIGALSLIVIGGASVVGILAWLIWNAGLRIALYSLLHRITGVLLLAVRLFLTFQSIGVPLSFLKAFPVTLAMIAGSAASITPGGVGISEILAALIANVVQVVPAAAFVAVGLDRLLALQSCGLAVLAAHARRAATGSGTTPSH